MTADVEDEYIVCQATEPIDENGCLINDRITCRRRDEFVEVDRKDVDLMDVSPRMMVSVATAFIPFLDHDDAKPRADGREHAASGCAAAAHRSTGCCNRHGIQGCR